MPNLPGLFFLQNYPREEIWRLFVDGSFWSKEQGWKGYESREPGSLNAALESLCSIALEVEEASQKFELSVDLIKRIHKKCGKEVKKLEDISPGETRTGKPVFFAIPASRASIKGIEEFLQLFFLIEGGAEFGLAKQGRSSPIIVKNYFKDLKPEHISDLAKQIYKEMSKNGHSENTHVFFTIRENIDVYLEVITNSYNKEIKEAQTLDEKLRVIAKHIRYYELLHPFWDANGRTFVNNLLNILLMQHGLPPATFYEPNVFDLYSADELVEVIKEAIFNTTEIFNRDKRGITLYGYTATGDEKKRFLHLLASPSFDRIRDIVSVGSEVQQSCNKKTKDCISTLHEKYPLHRGAIYPNDVGDLKLLVAANKHQINKRIEQGAPPVYVGRTPLHMAIMMGNNAMIDALVNDADLSITDYDGKTAFHYAAEYGNSQTMAKLSTVLLASGVGVFHVFNIKDSQGKTALHYAVEYGDSELVTSLLTTNAIQINQTDKQGTFVLTLAYKNRKSGIFESLLNSGADVSDDLLELIAGRRDEETLKKIIANNDKLLKSKAAFTAAVKVGNVSLVSEFLREGMDIDQLLNNENETPVMLATNKGHVKLVKYLLDKGANINLTNMSGDSVLQCIFYASAEHRKELIKIIAAKDITLLNKPNASGKLPLYYALVKKDRELIFLFLDLGAGLDHVDSEGNNSLHIAMSTYDLPLIKEIVSRDRTLLGKFNLAFRTPFHQALEDKPAVSYPNVTEEKLIELIDYLIRERIDLNTKDIKGRTLLDSALLNKYYLLCVKLVKAGAQTNVDSPSTFLTSSDSDSILNSKPPTKFKEELLGTLDENPLIAMAQVNDLYLEIKNNNIRTPSGYSPKTGLKIFKGKSDDIKAHDKVLSVLKEIYASKLNKLVGNNQEDKLSTKQQVINENLKALIKCEKISGNIDKPSMQVVEGATVKIIW